MNIGLPPAPGMDGVAARIADVRARVAGFEGRFGALVADAVATPTPAPAPAMAGSPVAAPPVGATVGRSMAGAAAPPDWAAGLPADAQPWVEEIGAAAERHGLDPRLLASLVWSESGFRPDAVSHAGAIGLAQLMPGTAAGLGVDPHDPVQNLDGGARFLRAMLDRFGRPDLALAAYNAGPGRVAQAGGFPRSPRPGRTSPRSCPATRACDDDHRPCPAAGPAGDPVRRARTRVGG